MKQNKKFTKKSTLNSKKTEFFAAFSQVSKKEHEQKSKGFLGWLDEHILLILSAFLFAFIPLYPKLPLADLIPGYIVRLRIEDIFVGITVLIYGIQVIRKKAEWKTPFTWIVLGYAAIGLLSTASGVFITKTIPFGVLHIAKSMLHFFRYMEYFSLFFVAYSAIKKQKDLVYMLVIFTVTVVLISIYGYGQKYYYWPVYSTMNREFSKGMRLYLTEHARVQSTFGGHYDMSGYLVVALPIILSLFFFVKNWKLKFPLLFTYTFGLWLLIMGASRTSFAAIVVAIALVLVLFGIQQQTLQKKIVWFFTRSFLIFAMLGYMFIVYGDSIAERFMQTLRAYPQFVSMYDAFNDSRKKLIAGDLNDLLSKYNISMPEAKKPDNAMSTDELASKVLVPSDETPTNVPPDVYVNVPETVYVTTVSAEGVATTTAVEKERTFSSTAQTQGLSMAIRLDTLWPRAIAGFYKNPLLGSGYATLTKENVQQFTEAESTDNNFLRTLGETGLLGFITFYGTIVIGNYFAIRVLYSHHDLFSKTIAIGFISASVGLLINAIFIDVYASSKIAFTYWALTGFVLAYFIHDLHIAQKKLT